MIVKEAKSIRAMSRSMRSKHVSVALFLLCFTLHSPVIFRTSHLLVLFGKVGGYDEDRLQLSLLCYCPKQDALCSPCICRVKSVASGSSGGCQGRQPFAPRLNKAVTTNTDYSCIYRTAINGSRKGLKISAAGI